MSADVAAVLAGEARWALVDADARKRLRAEAMGMSSVDIDRGQRSLFGG